LEIILELITNSQTQRKKRRIEASPARVTHTHSPSSTSLVSYISDSSSQPDILISPGVFSDTPSIASGLVSESDVSFAVGLEDASEDVPFHGFYTEQLPMLIEAYQRNQSDHLDCFTDGEGRLSIAVIAPEMRIL